MEDISDDVRIELLLCKFEPEEHLGPNEPIFLSTKITKSLSYTDVRKMYIHLQLLTSLWNYIRSEY